MSTSLAEQLRRLTVPQTANLYDSKERASILFDSKEAANKDYKIIYDLGCSGLKELNQIDSSFTQFENTLFDIASMRLERAIETENINILLDKNIKKFFYRLSPYFMLQPAHLCLEWLVRRFHIHEYNKADLVGLILPYHETKIFVKCVQLFNFKDPNDPWKWLEPIQKPGVGLSKTTLFNKAASDTAFLKFVCDHTLNAIKELDTKAHTLQAQINFFYTTIIGALEYTHEVSESHILSILPSVLKGLDTSSQCVDFTAAALMITLQLCCKTQLTRKILHTLIGKICLINFESLQNDVILALIVIYQKQSECLNNFPEEHLNVFISKKWITITLDTLSVESVTISPICCPLVSICLINIQTKKEGWNECKDFLESLLTNVHFKGDDVHNLIRAILDNYQRKEIPKMKLSESEVIEIDSDNDDVMPEVDVKLWYSQYLKELEKQYPEQFDNVIKEILKEDNDITESRKQALKAVLAFRLKSTYFEDNTTIYENLYHFNSRNRIEGVKFLVKNFCSLNITGDNLIKETLKDRLNDDDPAVVAEVLKLSSKELVELFSKEEFVNVLIRILCKCQSTAGWTKPIPSALNHLTRKDVYSGTDLNRILLAIIPFMIVVSESELNSAKIIFSSDLVKELDILRVIVTNITLKSLSSPREVSAEIITTLQSTKDLPKPEEFLKSFNDVADDNFTKLFNLAYFLLLLDFSYANTKLSNIDEEVITILMKIKNKKFYHIANNVKWLKKVRENKIPLNIYLNLLKAVVEGTKFSNLQNFNIDSKSHQIYLQIYEFLITSAFKKSEKHGKHEYEKALKDILQFCFSNSDEKLKFLSNFFVTDRISDSIINPELQIRSIRLFDIVLIGKDRNYKIDSRIFTKIIIALSSKIQAIRESALKTLETLLNIKEKDIIDDKIKMIIFKILEHSEEIKMHDEHLSLIFSLIMSSDKKTKKSITAEETECATFVLNQFLDMIVDDSIEIYIKAELLEALKHITSLKILKKILKLGLQILESYEQQVKENNDCVLNESEGKIFELITLRYDENTIKLLLEEPNAWKFIEKSLQLHKILLNNIKSHDNVKGKFVSIASPILEIFDEQTYNQMPNKFKEDFFNLLINAITFNDRDTFLASNAKKFMKRIQLNCQHIIQILEKMKNICNEPPAASLSSSSSSKRNSRIKLRNIAPDPQILNSIEWKNGITLLEFLQNKKKLEHYNILIPILFDILNQCVNYEEQFSLEYVKQLVLSCLLILCQKFIELPLRSRELPETIFKIDLIVQCIRGTQNSQTHHHALLLLSHCATIVPQQVLHNIMSIFTFMGSSVVRHDDAFSFQIISNIIESVIPTLIKANGKQKNNQEYDDELVIPVLKVFADIVLDVPEHRRLPLYTKLIRILGASKYLWMFFCVLFESHVMHSEKKKETKSSNTASKFSTNVDDLPKRLEIALQIVKDFEPLTTIETCTSLLTYLKKLPSDKRDDEENMEIDITDSTLFNVDTHTSKQLRHYKYIILQFISSFLTSVDFVNQIALLETEEATIMKPFYQELIVKVLSYILDVIRTMEKITDNNQVKFWKIILHHCYDILDSAISLLSPDMLLIVVYGLMQNQLATVKKKVIDILIHKLQYKADYFDNCNEENMLKLLEPLTDICDSILGKEKLIENATTNDIIYIQQTALIALKILSKLLAAKYPQHFKEILMKLTKVLKKHDSTPKILLATVVLCIAEISSNLRAHAIVHLPKFMPLLIELLEHQSDILNKQPPDSICIAIITGIQKVFEVLPLFLGPYIIDIVCALIKIWIRSLRYQDEEAKTNVIITKLTSIWTKIANVIPLRILIPNCDKAYLKLIEEKEYSGVGYLMILLKESFKNSSGSDIQSMQSEIITLFLNVLEFRAQFHDKVDKVDETEEHIIIAFVSLTLKLSESSFRPLYYKVYDWALRENTSKEKSITYFFLSSRISEALKSLFVLFASDFIQQAAELLDKCNSIKSNELYFIDLTSKNLILIEYILQTLFNVFLHDSKGFINLHRFDILMQPLVDQLENPFIISNQKLQELLLSTLSQLAVAVSNDTLWKQLNYQILLKTRNNNPDIRILSFNCCVEIARKLGEDFNPLLPETIPFIAELFEDEIQRVEKSCKHGVRELEKILGESLQKYF